MVERLPIKKKRKVFIRAWHVIVIVICIAVIASWLVVRHFQQRRILILYKTDHESLLLACRQLLAERRAGQWPNDTYYLDKRMQQYDSESEKLPQVILQLRPSYIYFDDNSVMVEMLGGFVHLGVIARAEGINEPKGDKQLIAGLDYYDDAYQEKKNCDQYIESLRP